MVSVYNDQFTGTDRGILVGGGVRFFPNGKGTGGPRWVEGNALVGA